MGAVIILGVMYLPMVLSEVCTHGDNWVQFKYALSGRGKAEFPLKMKVIQSLKLHSQYFWFTLTSWSDGANRWGILGFIGIIGGLGSVFLKSFCKNLKFIRSRQISSKLEIQTSHSAVKNSRYLFFLLIWLWFGVMFVLYTKLAFNIIKPRYWLLEAPIFFIMIAVMLREVSSIQFFKQITRYKIQDTKKSQDTRYPPKADQPKVGKIQINSKIQDTNKFQISNFKFQIQNLNSIFNKLFFKFKKLKNPPKSSRAQILIPFTQGVIVIILVGMNLYAVGNWYWILQNQRDSNLPIWDLKLKDENKIPYRQLMKVVEYISVNLKKIAEKENKNICFYATGEYRPVYDYIFENKNLSKKIRRISFQKDTNKNCLFITIDHHRHRQTPRIPKDHKNEFEKIKNGKKEIGFVTIWRVARKEQKLKSDKQEMENDNLNKIKINYQNVDKASIENKNIHLEEQRKPKKPKRQERIKWKDLNKCW